MANVQPRTLSGFMELLPARQVQFDRMVSILRETYSLYGFTPLDTPLIEASEVLLAKGGGETEKQIYRFHKGDTDLALRFDLTVPLAKYVALHYGQLTFPFRRFQIGKVYRGERAQRGRFREFYQADIDVIGDGSPGHQQRGGDPLHHLPDLHRPGAEALPDPGEQPEDPQRLLRHAGSFPAVRRDHAHGGQAGQDRPGQGGRCCWCSPASLRSRPGEILSFIAITGTNEEVLTALEGYRGRNEVFDLGLDELTPW